MTNNTTRINVNNDDYKMLKNERTTNNPTGINVNNDVYNDVYIYIDFKKAKSQTLAFKNIH